ncbi:HD-GYP domain-containing protein [Sporosarcina sp. Marseille-Q4063]|uniref:HD-GYP domain-containing protein n=1 Tax=Sporosarcina sp. Marseille-Q4063 TaxID=2810514 RepID=UPI00201621A8|nr:HD-GYP domain-containing protein [Sporosarcina sp. Marseille-Q4063]
MLQNKSYYTQNGYPTLHLGYADVILYGRWQGLSNALYSLQKDNVLWVQHSKNATDSIIETYTLLNGVVEMRYDGKSRQLKIGETIDASLYENTIFLYGNTDADILIKTSHEEFEPEFFETQLLQEEADAIEALDGYTYNHCNRIKDYSLEVWTHLGLPNEKLRILRWGAYFHDIGKREIPLEVLNKPGDLTACEWAIMKTHTIEGAKIMREHKVKWLKDAATIVEQHHERFDGSGYPYGLKADEISLEASIVAVVDAFDAMTTNRIYKKALPIKDAIKELINEKGKQFNPKIVDAFIEVLKRKNYKWEY